MQEDNNRAIIICEENTDNYYERTGNYSAVPNAERIHQVVPKNSVFDTMSSQTFQQAGLPPHPPCKYKTASLVTAALQTATSTKEARRASAILPNESLHSDGPLAHSQIVFGANCGGEKLS
jgi:isocitrate dehydrogenase